MVRRLSVACIAGAFLIAPSARAIDWNDPSSVIAEALAASPALREIEAQVAAAHAREREAAPGGDVDLAPIGEKRARGSERGALRAVRDQHAGLFHAGCNHGRFRFLVPMV